MFIQMEKAQDALSSCYYELTKSFSGVSQHILQTPSTIYEYNT